MKKASTLVAIGVILAAYITSGLSAERSVNLPAPIIAELFANSKAFTGRRVVIYGLVIESNSSGTEFLLQDVSQRPIKIVGNSKLKAAVGDQLTVTGVVRSHSGSPYLVAKRLVATRVTAGGGCC